jgi:hypothetical protein
MLHLFDLIILPLWLKLGKYLIMQAVKTPGIVKGTASDFKSGADDMRVRAG